MRSLPTLPLENAPWTTPVWPDEATLALISTDESRMVVTVAQFGPMSVMRPTT